MKIPKKIRIGGQEIVVTQPKTIGGTKLGICSPAGGYIKIAETFDDGIAQSESSKINTFWHEVTHVILDTMGREDLSGDETFVSCFSGFLTECIASIEESEKRTRK